METPRLTTVLSLVGLMLMGGLIVQWAKHRSFFAAAWPDECIYMAGARNLAERGTLQTNFYLTYSLLRRGYPQRDVHMPGYIILLAPFARWRRDFGGPATLNTVLFLASILLVYGLALRILSDRRQAVAAAALFAVLPPFPAYLFVAYPEIAITFVLLGGILWVLWGDGSLRAVISGVLFGASPLFRETLLLALPIFVARMKKRELLFFLPATLTTLALVVYPLSRGRALHPNAIYPSVLEQAQHSGSPFPTLLGALLRNAADNFRLVKEANPWRNPEDMALAFFALLTLAAVFSLHLLPAPSRRLAIAIFVSLALLGGATLALYVVRERGGVWGGVRVCMAWAPLLLVLATPVLFRPKGPWLRACVLSATFAGFLALDFEQTYFVFRYKQSDHEDQERNAGALSRYIDRYHPQRIVSRSFTYGLSHYPVEVVWSLPADQQELKALESRLPFDFLVLHERSPLRSAVVQNPRYLRLNADERAPEFLIYRRIF